MTRLPALAVVLGAALLALPSAASAGFFTQSAAVGPGNVHVYDPARDFAEPNSQFTWMWASSTPHSVTAYDGEFDSGVHTSGAPNFAPTLAPGRHEYFCTIHGSLMEGVVSVPALGAGEHFPEVDADGDIKDRTTRAYTLGASAMTVAPDIKVGQLDGDDVISTRARIVSGAQAGDVLSIDLGGAESQWDDSTKTLTITATGGATVPPGHTQSALRAVRFSASSGTGTRRISFDATDGGATAPERHTGNPDYIDVAVSAPATNNNNNNTGGGGGTNTTPPPPGPAPFIPPPFTPAPPAPTALALTGVKKSLTVDGKGLVTITFTTTPNATGTAELVQGGTSARAAQKPKSLGRASFRANRAGKARVKVRLTPSARRTLRRKRRLPARLVIRSGGKTASTAVTVRAR